MGGGFNTTNPINKKGKTIKIISIIILLILIVISISFALGNIDINLLGRRNIKISKCELDINFKESEELMLVSKYPISKEEALKYIAKEINITNNSTCDTAYYKVTIKDLVNSSINKDKINYQVVDKSTNTETIDKNPDNFNISDSLTKGNTKTYTIRLWIDESATNTDLFINGDTTKPIEYKYALNIESSDEEIKTSMNATEFATKTVGTNGLEEVKESDTVTSYRYRGKDVNNYVTFNNETWRIIGIIPIEDSNKVTETRFKLIKPDSVITTSYPADSYDFYLNKTYYNSLSDLSKNMIINTSFTSFDENGNEVWTSNPKIELIRLNDYKYSSNTLCSADKVEKFSEDETNCITNNWLYYGSQEWTLSWVDSGGGVMVFDYITSKGTISGEYPDTKNCANRPVVSLTSSIKITGGTGTSSDPYKLSL